MRTVAAPHITLDKRGIAYVDSTETKVLTVVRNKKMSRDTPEQLRMNMPHLTLSQVYAAIAYYLDHQTEIDSQIGDLDLKADRILAAQPPGPTRDQLLSRKARRRSRVSVA